MFRTDVETLLTREVVDAAVVPGRHELAPASGLRYVAFVDPSGGSADSMTLAIAHRDATTNRVMLDAVRERRPPFSPDQVAKEFCDLLRAYHVGRVTGDRFGGEWPRERFRAHGIQYDLAEKPKSDLYGGLLPLLNAGRAELLDLPRLAPQLVGLERRTARSGRDSIDHTPGGHDDVANSVAGVAHCRRRAQTYGDHRRHARAGAHADVVQPNARSRRADGRTGPIVTSQSLA